MSIIHDALKKVQDTSHKRSAATVTPQIVQEAPIQASTLAPVAESTQPAVVLTIGILFTLALIVFFVISNLPRKPLEQKLRSETAEVLAQNPDVPATPEPLDPVQAQAKEQPVTQTQPEPSINPSDSLSSIKIEGILDMGTKKVALINGNIYEEGQTIFGKIIASITMEGIIVMDNGAKRTFLVDKRRP